MRQQGLSQRPAERLSLPDIVSDAASVCVRHARLLLPLALPGALLAAAGSYALLVSAPETVNSVEPTAEEVQRAALDAAPWLAVAAAGRVFTHAALVAGVLGIKREQNPSAGAAFAAAVRALPVALLSFLLILLAVSLLSATILLIPLALYLLVGWVFSAQLIIDDRLGPFRALSASRRLVSGQWWRTFGVGAAVLLLSLLPEFVIAQIVGRAGSDLAASAGAGLAALAGAPFVAAGLSLLYLDTRRVKTPFPPPAPQERTHL